MKRTLSLVLIFALLLMFAGCGKPAAYSTPDPADLTGVTSGQPYTLVRETAPVYRDLKAKQQTWTDAQIESVKSALNVQEGDYFDSIDNHWMCFRRQTMEGAAADRELPQTAEQAVEWADAFLKKAGVFPTGEYITEVKMGTTCNVSYYPTYKGVPVVQQGLGWRVQITYTCHGVDYFYCSWVRFTGGRAYRDGDVCTVQEAVNKFERSMFYPDVIDGAVKGNYVRQVYVVGPDEYTESWWRQIFTGNGAHYCMVILPGFAFSADETGRLSEIYQTVAAVPDPD